jgi:hypothetical protein
MIEAFSAPAPVRERTSISAYFAALCSDEVTEPSQPRKKDSGIVIMPGLSSGNQWKSKLVNMDGTRAVGVAAPETVGLKMIRMRALMSRRTC